MTAEPLTPLRELHSREATGLLVRLLWSRPDDHTIVAVLDIARGDSFHIDVRADENPVDVFHHPYAYAALRGIATGSGRRPLAVAA
jgi:hypothetical protein